MLVVPHALHCVDSCIFVFYLIWHNLANCFGFSAPHPPFPKYFFIRFSFFVKIHLLESSVRVVGLHPLLLSQNFFIRFNFGLLFTASTSPWQRPYSKGILLSYATLAVLLLAYRIGSCLLLLLLLSLSTLSNDISSEATGPSKPKCHLWHLWAGELKVCVFFMKIVILVAIAT